VPWEVPLGDLPGWMPPWNGWYASEQADVANTATCRKPERECFWKSTMSSPASIADARSGVSAQGATVIESGQLQHRVPLP